MLFQRFRVKFSISFFYFIEPGKYGFLSSSASNDYTEQTRKLWGQSAPLTRCGGHQGTSGSCLLLLLACVFVQFQPGTQMLW